MLDVVSGFHVTFLRQSNVLRSLPKESYLQPQVDSNGK